MPRRKKPLPKKGQKILLKSSSGKTIIAEKICAKYVVFFRETKIIRRTFLFTYNPDMGKICKYINYNGEKYYAEES